MICALMLGRKGSAGFPGKNLYPVLGRPLMEYPFLAAKYCRKVDRVFISTDDEEIMKLGKKHGAEMIARPPELASKSALGEHAYRHGYQAIKERIQPAEVELMILLFCN